MTKADRISFLLDRMAHWCKRGDDLDRQRAIVTKELTKLQQELEQELLPEKEPKHDEITSRKREPFLD